MKNAVLLAVIVVCTALAAGVGFAPSRAGNYVFPAFVGGTALVLAAFAILMARREEVLAAWLKPKWGDLTAGIVFAVITCACAWAFVKFVATPGTPREAWIARLYAQLGDPAPLRAHVPLVVLAVVLIAASEEIVWRGLVPWLLEPRVGSRRAWIYAAILYALAHVPTAYALRDPTAGLNPVLVLGALGAGLLWGGMTRYFGRLLPAIIAHAFFDWCVIMMFRLWGPSV